MRGLYFEGILRSCATAWIGVPTLNTWSLMGVSWSVSGSPDGMQIERRRAFFEEMCAAWSISSERRFDIECRLALAQLRWRSSWTASLRFGGTSPNRASAYREWLQRFSYVLRRISSGLLNSIEFELQTIFMRGADIISIEFTESHNSRSASPSEASFATCEILFRICRTMSPRKMFPEVAVSCSVDPLEVWFAFVTLRDSNSFRRLWKLIFEALSKYLGVLLAACHCESFWSGCGTLRYSCEFHY